MKVVLLCGGFGTRLAEETSVRPKPMVEVGGKPIMWHIMKSYSLHGIKDFVLAMGYKSEYIKEYFTKYHLLSGDLKIKLGTGEVKFENRESEDWSLSLIETGKDSLTGGRLKRLESEVRPSGTFMLTYGDGVCNVDIQALLDFHRSHGKIATVTAVRPPARFGGMSFNEDAVTSFSEKNQTDAGWINGGYFVFEPEIFDYLEDDKTILERAPMERLVCDQQLMAYKHPGFWQCMDTLRDKQYLEEICQKGYMPWLDKARKLEKI
jgi:glucose-1-phosphate cytidylyltransferase